MKNRYVDGLRGLAALNVAICHYIAAFLPMMLYRNYPAFFPENNAPIKVFSLLTSPVFSIIYNGHFPVIIFFVISGYVLTLPYFLNESADTRLNKRLFGRYIRLNIPIATAILISYIVYKIGFYRNMPASVKSGSVKWLNAFFVESVMTTKNAIYEATCGSIVLGKNYFLPPSWTLQIEFIGSIYILIFYLVKPKKNILIPLCITFLIIYAVHKEESIYYYAIFFGSLLNYFQKGSHKVNIILFSIGVYFGGFLFKCKAYNFLPDVMIWEKKNFYNTIGAVFLTLAVIRGFGGRFFNSKILQFLGRISYSLYLLHFIILCSISCIVYLYFLHLKTVIFLNFCFYIFLCLVASKIFEMAVDRPAITLSHKFSSWLFK